MPTSKRPDIPIHLFCYHKVGTTLLTNVFSELCRILGWRFALVRGNQSSPTKEADIVLWIHSLTSPDHFGFPYVGVHFIRDPRDIIVSGYLYHLRTVEKWCINRDFAISGKIIFPQVPYAVECRSESWKANYLRSLNGISYQDNLQKSSQNDGLIFEMMNYSAWTIEAMRNWNYSDPGVLEIRFEEIMSDYEKSFSRIFEHLQFDEKEKEVARHVSNQHNIFKMNKDQVAQLKHVSSLQTTRWKDYFTPSIAKQFISLFDSTLVDLGYENDNTWFS